MLKKIFLFFFSTLVYVILPAQEKKFFLQSGTINPFQFIEREREPYSITRFSVDAQSAGLLDKYDLSKFRMVSEVVLNFSSTDDSLLQSVLTKLSVLPALKAIEFTEYPIFPPRDRSKFGQKKFPAQIGLFKNLQAIRFALYKNYDWEDILTKISSLAFLEELDIHLSYFDHIPAALRKLSNIHSLTIYDNEWIESLPEWITEFKKLEELKIGQNPKLDYTNAFKLLGTLPNLHSIDLSYSVFNEVPLSFADMRSLQNVSGTGLKVANWENFFTTLSQLPGLTAISFNAGDSMVLPPVIGQLKKLKYISLYSRKIQSLPVEIGQLKDLETLVLEGNQIQELPISIYRLQKLHWLDLSYNQLKSLSSDIGLLQNVEYLNLTKNDLEEIPEETGRLVKCKNLLLSNNHLHFLPGTISELRSLEELSVAKNQLEALIPDYSTVSQLKKIDATNNSIRELAPSIGKLTKLEILSLNNNFLEKLPASICNLENLHELSISSNNLHELPGDMGKLSALTSLDLSSGRNTIHQNSFHYIPASLSRLTNLRTLWLRENSMLDGDSAVRVILRIKSAAERIDMSNCNISSLPQTGWKDCLFKYIDFGNNHISVFPTGILEAPELRYLRLNQNPVPAPFNRSFDSKEELMITAVEAGALNSYSVLPRTPVIGKALYEEGNTHFIYQRYAQTVFLYHLADSLFDYTAFKNNRRPDYYGIAQHHIGKYKEAILNISAGLQKDTAGQIRIMNFIDPEFQYLAESYLLTKDTAQAIMVYEKWSRFSSGSTASSEMALLLLDRKDKQGSQKWFGKAAAQYRRSGDKTPLSLLSILEAFVMADMTDSVNNFPATIDTVPFNQAQKLMIQYLVQVNHIKNGTSSKTDLALLLEKIEYQPGKKEGWSYDVFDSWLQKTDLTEDQRLQVQQLTNAVKQKIHS